MVKHIIILQEINNGFTSTEKIVKENKDDAIHFSYQIAKKFFYLLNPYGNDPDFIDEDGERYQFLEKNTNGNYFMKTKMNGELIIKICVETRV